RDVYETKQTEFGPAQRLTIEHPDDKPVVYKVETAADNNTSSQETPSRQPKSDPVSFANSDFWIVDFGLEFLRWPEQRMLKKEMRKGRSCKVIESVNPSPEKIGYSKVHSWIDSETGGLIRAESFDWEGKLLKEFSV